MRGERDVSGGNHARRARQRDFSRGNHAGERDVSRGNHKVYLARRLEIMEASEKIMEASEMSQEEITRGRLWEEITGGEGEARETSREEESVWGEGGNLHLTGTVHSICLDNSCYL